MKSLSDTGRSPPKGRLLGVRSAERRLSSISIGNLFLKVRTTTFAGSDTFIATFEIKPESREFAIGDCNLRSAQLSFAGGPVPKEVMVNAVFTLIGEGQAGRQVTIQRLASAARSVG